MGRRFGRRVASATRLALLAPWYITFAVLKHVVPVERLARLAWAAPRPGRNDRQQRIVETVVRLRTLVGARGDCVEGSLLLYRALSRLGIAPTLVVGLRRDGSSLGGHSWVEVDGAPVAERAEDLTSFVVAARFGPGGRRASAPRVAGLPQQV